MKDNCVTSGIRFSVCSLNSYNFITLQKQVVDSSTATGTTNLIRKQRIE